MLYGEPFISTRQSIAWIPSNPDPFEDSDVLVLSSRATSPGGVGAILFYLDLRLSLPFSRTSKINWGFAGPRHTLSISPLRFRWAHTTIDSRDDGLVDEGEVIQRDGIDIETGVGLNPATGHRETYEEIWRDEPLPAGSPYIFVSSSANIEEASAVMAVLGPHGLALSQETEDPSEPKTFRAVRMHRRTSTCQDIQGSAWEIVFSTGSSAQERELKELVKFADQVRPCACRDSSICFGNRSWIVWDVGRVGTIEIIPS